MREIQKHCDTCNHSYREREGSVLRQKCRSTEYNAETYTHEMFVEDRGQGHCRFWTPKIRKGSAHICYETVRRRLPRTRYGGGYSQPLWIVAEAKQQGLRIWVSHVGDSLVVETADMNLPSDSREYHESHQRYEFCTQTAVADCLDKLLRAA